MTNIQIGKNRIKHNNWRYIYVYVVIDTNQTYRYISSQ